MSSPALTVVIPAYNAAATIRRALDSLRAQTCRDFEIIVIDDGSEDETAHIVQEEYPEVRYIRQDNAGPCVARNRGAQEGCGEFVSFLDADDEWAPEKAERQLALLRARPDVDCCGTNGWVLAGERRYLFNSPHRPRVIELALADLIWGYHPVLASLMVRRSVFIELEGYDASMAHCEDQELIYRIAGTGHKVVELNEPLYIIYRMSDSRSSKASVRRAVWRLRALERWDPQRNPQSPLTRRQYVRALGHRAIISAAECYREGGHERARELLAWLDDVPDVELAHKLLHRLAQVSYPAFGVMGNVYRSWRAFVDATRRWGGVTGLARQFWRRYISSGPAGKERSAGELGA